MICFYDLIVYENGSAILNMGERSLIFDGQCLDMEYSGSNSNPPVISRVKVANEE